MISRITRLWLSLILALLALGLAYGLAMLASPEEDPDLDAMSTLDRHLEPVIVKNVFPTAPVDEVFVYRETGGVWQQIPFQIDEVTSAGAYVETEGNGLDANDEVVFMAKDLGGQATTSITGSLPISATWYEVEVVDPLNAAKRGWAYIVRSSALAPGNPTDYASYIGPSQRISATNYTIGWATSHAGQDYLSLFGGGDVMDRTKLRIRYKPLLLPEQTWTEDDLVPPPTISLLKDGPVRVIVSRGAAMTFGYASFLQTITPIDLSSLLGTLKEVRVSTDLEGSVTGVYYNENASGGVTIDGNPVPDPTVATPFLKPWRQVSLTSGTLIQVADAGSLGGSFSHYYKDDSSIDANDTGDQMSFGDSGVRVVDPTLKVFSFQSAQYFLPGAQSNRGDEFYNYFTHPLQVTSTFNFEANNSVYLPLVVKGN